MTADREALVAEVAEVVAAHRWAYLTFQQRTVLACTCGDQLIPWTSSAVATMDDFNAHLADALADLLAAREQQARAEAWDDGEDAGYGGAVTGMGSGENPYRESDV